MRIKKIDTIVNRILISAIVIGALLMIILVTGGYAPFGSKSLATMDAKIQYLDFFCFLKDIFNGENSIIYSFSKSLGGSYFAVFSYYLASPFNFLVIFFEKENFIILFHLLVALKLIMSGVTFTVFLYYRFNNKIGMGFSTLLSLGFALAQYNIAQSSNIMWLDGVYLLPLILLGVYKLVKKKRVVLLAISVALSLLFNWYTGCINCLFSAAWLLYEIALEKNVNLKEFFSMIGRYAISMILGILMSCAVFFPSILSLLSGRGNANWKIFNLGMVGNPASAVVDYELGGVSDVRSVSLYVGCLAMLGVLMFFFSRNIRPKEKVATLIFSIVGVAMYYWMPLYFLFSLLKSVTSYWSRYSYLGCFFILFVSGFYFATISREKKASTVIKAAAVFVLVKVLGNLVSKNEIGKWGGVTVLIFLIIAACMYVILKLKEKVMIKKMAAGILAVFVILDAGINTSLIFETYSDNDGVVYKDYVAAESDLIEDVKIMDDGSYRISDLYPRNVDNQTNLRANYNEAAAFNYWSISGYDSDPDEIQRSFLDRLGYRINGENMCIVNTAVLPVDSLLGIKYVLSDREINGLNKVAEVGAINKKELYENPYAFPMAFVYDKNDYQKNGTTYSVFEYVNSLYSQIIGEKTEVFKRMDFHTVKNENQIEYELEMPYENSIVIYGNILWNYEVNGKLFVNNEFRTNYSQWLSPAVFYVGERDDSGITVRLETEYSADGIREAEFYYVDLESYGKICELISAHTANDISIMNGEISCKTEGKEGEYLFLSVPYDESWDISVNGKKVEPELFGECLMTVPLEEGENQIELSYSVQGLKVGILLSAIGLTGVFFVLIWGKIRNK